MFNCFMRGGQTLDKRKECTQAIDGALDRVLDPYLGAGKSAGWGYRRVPDVCHLNPLQTYEEMKVILLDTI